MGSFAKMLGRVALAAAACLSSPVLAPPDPPLGSPTVHAASGREVTFGLEAEFQPTGPAVGLLDENLNANTSRVPFAFQRGTIENRHGPGSSNNRELNTLPVNSLDRALDQMRHLTQQFGNDPNAPPPRRDETPGRSFHMHIHVPMEFFDALPEGERLAAVRAFSSRMSDALMARRLAIDPYFGIGTKTVSWLPPQNAEDRGAVRMIVKPLQRAYDFEIRGTRLDIALMEEFAKDVVRVARNPGRIQNPPTDLLEALHLPAQTLPEFMASQPVTLSADARSALDWLKKATVDSDLPLHRFDEIPLFAKQKAVIEAANAKFARAVQVLAERMARENPTTPAAKKQVEAEYRKLIQQWGNDIKLTELLGPNFLWAKESMSKEAQHTFLIERAAKAARIFNDARDVPGMGRVAVALDGSKDPAAHKILVELAQNPIEAVSQASIRALHGAPPSVLSRILAGLPATMHAEALHTISLGTDPARVPVILRSLNNARHRNGAIFALRNVHTPEAVAALIRMANLPDDDERENLVSRRWAMEALTDRSDAASLEELQKHIDSPHSPTKIAARRAFRGRTDDAALIFVRDLIENNPSHEGIAVMLSGMVNHPNEVLLRSAYLAAMLSPNGHVRMGVVEAVSQRSEPWAMELARSLATDSEPGVRAQLMKQLALRRDSSGVVELLEIGLRDPKEDVRWAALDALTLRMDDRSLELLRRVVVSQASTYVPDKLPSLGPPIQLAQLARYVDAFRAGKSLRGECVDVFGFLDGGIP